MYLGCCEARRPVASLAILRPYWTCSTSDGTELKEARDELDECGGCRHWIIAFKGISVIAESLRGRLEVEVEAEG